MSLSSGKIRRLEKEAILRSKEHDYKCERSAYLITNSYRDEEDDEYDRHRRHEKMRQTRQIQREIDYQVGMIEKMNERRKQELQKKPNPINTIPNKDYLQLLPPPTTPISPEAAEKAATERAFRTAALIEKYTNKKNSSGNK